MPEDAPRQPPAIEVQDLHKHFGTAHVLRGVGVLANDGDVVSLIGSSGSGKSTFLRCINMLETPSSGRIFLGGEELSLKAGRRGLEPATAANWRTSARVLAWCFNPSTFGSI